MKTPGGTIAAVGIAGLVGIAVALGAGCSRSENPQAAAGMMGVTLGPRDVVLKVEGMACEGCASGITDELTALPGVETCRVVLKEGRVFVKVAEKDGATVERMIAAIEENPSHKASVETRGSGVASK